MDEDPRVEAVAKAFLDSWHFAVRNTTLEINDLRAKPWPDNPMASFFRDRARELLAVADAVDPLRLGRT